MKYIILGAWVIQAVAGLTLLIKWARHARGKGASSVITHAAIMLACLASWAVYAFTDAILWSWLAWGALMIGIPFGERQMIGRARRLYNDNATGTRSYAIALRAVFTGKLPPLVTFHAVFSAVVFFGSLSVAIGATLAA